MRSTMIRIVQHIDIALDHLIEWIGFENGTDCRDECTEVNRNGAGLCQGLSIGREQARRRVQAFLDDG